MAASVAKAVVKRRFQRGEAIVEQGKKSTALTILLTGRARVTSCDSRGREVILATLRPGDQVGEMSLIDDEPHSASVRAEVQSDSLIREQAEFAHCMPDMDSMAHAIFRGVVQRLRHANSKIESLALMEVYGRVAKALLEFGGENAMNREGHAVIPDRVSLLVMPPLDSLV